MEQNKYREQIQNEFINPSVDSWEKLYQKLDEHDHSKNNSYRNYLKYAVSLVFIVSLGFYFIPTNNNPKSERIGIEQQVNQISIKPSVIEQNINSPLEITSEKILASEIAPANNSLAYEVSKKINIQGEESSEPSETFVFNSNPQNTKNVLLVITAKPELSLDYEVEELIRIANLNLEKGNQNLNSNSIMAMDLLGEVENDLKNDHRRKLFEKITISINSPGILEIADRNK